jgi:putative mRNA 3-end processing factor
MAASLLQFTHKGIYCPQGNFYIDPWRPVAYAVITHGHADHAHWGMQKYLCHDYTLPIIKTRLGADIQAESIAYNSTKYINGVQVSFHPAGHVIGSAQIRLEYKGQIIVVSGDYKLQNDGLSTAFEPIKCHEFVTESTFGLPIYNWEPVSELNNKIRAWVINNIQQGKTPVLIGYSLGKAQRLMKALEGIGPMYVHHAIHKLNEALKTVNIQLPSYELLQLNAPLKPLEQKIIIVPPSLIENPTLKKIPQMVYAICSGWMQIRGARRWRSADAGFAMSDHADWPDLLTAIKETQAEKVYVTHGQTAVFTKYLNEIGIAAEVVPTEYGQEEDVIEEEKTTVNDTVPTSL